MNFLNLLLCLLLTTACRESNKTQSYSKIIHTKSDSLDLANLRLKDLPLDSFKNKKITYLNLLGNSELDLYNEEKLLNSLPLLTDLRVSVDSIEQIPLSLRNKIKGVQLNYYNINRFNDLMALKGLKYFSIRPTLGAEYKPTMGRISQKICDLEFLEELHLTDLGIWEVPFQIRKLTHLRILNLDQNQVSELPAEFRFLNNLEEFSVSSNKFTVFPKILYELPKLKKINFLFNAITFPDDINKLTAIEDISATKYYNLKIPKQFCDLKHLKSLKIWVLRESKLEFNDDFFPKEFVNLKSLQSLSLPFCNLKIIPNVIFKLTQLKELNLNDNYIKEIPKEISALKNLEVLNLRANPIDSFPLEITKLKNLISLDLWGTQIKEIPEEITSLKNIEYFNIDISIKGYNYDLLLNFKNLTAINLPYKGLKEIPESVFQFKNLKYLNLRGNQIKEIPDQIKNLKKLTKLDLTNNHINKISSEIANLPHLSEIEIGKNSNDGFKALCNALNTYHKPIYITTDDRSFPFYKFGLNIYLDTNITAIPVEIGKLKSLRELNLFRSKIKSIPDEIEECVDLVHFRAVASRLESINPNVGKLQKLKTLNLAVNKISVIPNEIFQLKNLEYLSLGSNSISSISEEIGNLDNLKMLELSKNKITNLPIKLLQLKELSSLNVNNNLIEHIPNEFFENKQITEFTFYNNLLPDKKIYNKARTRYGKIVFD